MKDMFSLNRFVNQEIFEHVLLESDFMKKCVEYYETFENDVFSYRPYYWGDDEEKMDLPNFEHKPSGFKLWWYKYPLRGNYCNMKITTEQFASILYDCLESENPKVKYSIGNTKWWEDNNESKRAN